MGAKVNGLIVPIGIVGLLVGAVFSWGANTNQIKINTADISDLDQKHNSDMKRIDDKLDVLLTFANQSMQQQIEIRTDLNYVKKDIEMLKNK